MEDVSWEVEGEVVPGPLGVGGVEVAGVTFGTAVTLVMRTELQ